LFTDFWEKNMESFPVKVNELIASFSNSTDAIQFCLFKVDCYSNGININNTLWDRYSPVSSSASSTSSCYFQSLCEAVRALLAQISSRDEKSTITANELTVIVDTIINDEIILKFYIAAGIQINLQSLKILERILSSTVTSNQLHNNVNNSNQLKYNDDDKYHSNNNNSSNNNSTNTAAVLAHNTNDEWSCSYHSDNNRNRNKKFCDTSPILPSVSVSFSSSMSDSSSSHSSSQIEEMHTSESKLSSISGSSYTSEEEESSNNSLTSSSSIQCSIHNITDDDTTSSSASTDSSSTDESSSSEEDDDTESIDFVGKTLVLGPQLLIIDSSPSLSWLSSQEMEDITDDHANHNSDDDAITSSSGSTEEYNSSSTASIENENEDTDVSTYAQSHTNKTSIPKAKNITNDEIYDYTSSEASTIEYSSSECGSTTGDDETKDGDKNDYKFISVDKGFAVSPSVINDSSSQDYLPAKIGEITDDNCNEDTVSSEETTSTSYTSSEASTNDYYSTDHETDDDEDYDDKHDSDSTVEKKNCHDESISVVGKTFAIPHLVYRDSSSHNYLPAKVGEITDDDYDDDTTSSEASTYTSYTSSEASTCEYNTSDEESEYVDENSNEMDNNKSKSFADKKHDFRKLIILDSSPSSSFYSKAQLKGLNVDSDDIISLDITSSAASSDYSSTVSDDDETDNETDGETDYESEDDDSGDDDNDDYDDVNDSDTDDDEDDEDEDESEDENDNKSINFVGKTIIFPRLVSINSSFMHNYLPTKVVEVGKF